MKKTADGFLWGKDSVFTETLRLLMEVREQGGWEGRWAESKASGSLFLALIER